MERIVLPTDLSPESARAIAKAVELAKALNLGITLFHAVPEPVVLTGAMPGSGMPLPEPDVKGACREAEQQMLALSESIEGVPVEVKVRAAPVTADAIVRYASDIGAWGIVMASHGRSGMRRLVLGSVAEVVLRRATCPVVVVPEDAGD
jgi:nucleotide-binding universal stress UspA family protein